MSDFGRGGQSTINRAAYREAGLLTSANARDFGEQAGELSRVIPSSRSGAGTGEVLGLQWKHVDLEKARLRIEQSLWHGLLVAPKTRESVRIINTSVVLLEAL